VCTPLEEGSFETSSGSAYAVPATKPCATAGAPATGPADTHCQGVTPQVVNGASCSIDDAGPAPSEDAGGPSATPDGGGTSPGDAGSGATCVPQGGACATTSDCCTTGFDTGATCVANVCTGPCDENGADGAYGYTHFGTSGNDDDCKYQVSYTASPICENNGTYFVVTASSLATGKPVTGASTFAEVCLSSSHPAPTIDARPPNGDQQVVEGPAGVYTVGPVQFDSSGTWTVRFHFNEFCCDVADDSPHGHAAFFIDVP
jgi:hypothetical protein